MKGYLVILLFFIPLSLCMGPQSALEKRLSINSDESSTEYTPLFKDSCLLAEEICTGYFRPNDSIHIGRDPYEMKILRRVTEKIKNSPTDRGLLTKSGSLLYRQEELEALRKTIFIGAIKAEDRKHRRKQKVILASCGCLQIVTAVLVSILTAGVTATACVLQTSYN